VVGRDDRDATGGEMLCQQVLEQALSLVVERRERLIEGPQRRTLYGQAS
jgi:hypothetical protein